MADVVVIPLILRPDVHRQLVLWCRKTAELLDAPGIARGDAMEALIDQLIEDPHTSEAVRQRLSDNAAENRSL